MKLSQSDVNKLLGATSPHEKSEVISKISAQYKQMGDDALTPEQLILVEDIFRLLIKNTEVTIRSALAESLKDSPNVPKDIIVSLANDVDEVALPVLKFSEVLNEDDLIDIIKTTTDVSRQLAIAERNDISPHVADALVEVKNETIITTLLNNYGAEFSNKSYTTIIDDLGSNIAIVEAMISRGALPLDIAEKLLRTVSDSIKNTLNKKYEIVFQSVQANHQLEKSLETATMKLLGLRSTDAQVRKLLQDLSESGKLSPFTALCMGNYNMFEVSLSRLARVPLNNVSLLLYDEGTLGLKALYDKADLPSQLFEAVALAIRAIHTLEAAAGKGYKQISFLPQQIITRMEDLARGKTIPNLDFLLVMLKHNAKL